MRSSYLVLLAVATIASCSARSTISAADQTMISTATQPHEVPLVNNKRALRARTVHAAAPDDEDEDRALNLDRMSVEKLEDILTNTNGVQAKKFAGWKKKNVLPSTVGDRIKKFSPADERYWGIGYMYRQYLNGIKPTSTYQRYSDDKLAELSQKIRESKVVSPSTTWSAWLLNWVPN
ncbi:hypothetical protein PHYPSEUDO_014394 [Phytophthora pseudosyringae]|uniref:RxLR effector protein n=1 Tax=Phytophthora pseudosyringae TaxID=221518 RepID=A0A8T1W5A9_9STRA|nr:hypothetical protein PHYPSEUDO_014394 [Phytophthora pseudosyringae]